ncbi:hypothetical protein OPV22_027729 [Ensete ventricosum]|uniref:Cytochrome b5 heme-binding domain-containing protein n=1 Tax=Ensete ventricosum TaxID=4639 RepID=A0AAV8P5M7_ENSVE|nr:hypothetical protein OPV22_027729 [Ensete ventricosum]
MATLSKLYSMREATEHNTRDDCWVVIHGKVYDVTSYLEEHPGGDDVLLSAAGRDSTEDFEDAGHSKSARDLMQDYYIGELDPDTAIPELEIFRKDKSSAFTTILMNKTVQYLAVPTVILGVSIVAGFWYSRNK